MKRLDFRTFFGGGLIFLGGLLLLEKFGLVEGAAGIFFGAALFLAAVYFLYVFIQNPSRRWWAIIPSMALLGMSANAIMPEAFEGLGSGIFLGVLGLAFFIVYFSDHSRWWGIIPGGVLFTLASIASFGNSNVINSGALLFIGLGLTFLLVAVLPNPAGQMQWAYIPAGVNVVIGALMGSQLSEGLFDYIWPAALILVGLVVVIVFFFKKD